MARAGLGAGWQCLFANDIDKKKAATYASNWGAEHLSVKDVASVTTADLPGAADLIWASFPCQDLSLAGSGAGLRGERSGTFWPFWQLMRGLSAEGRAPSLIVLENVCGALTSHEGKDFTAISKAIAGAGYRFGALVIDAAHFVPQSRPRLFIIAVSQDCEVPAEGLHAEPEQVWHTSTLAGAYRRLDKTLREKWLWWRLPEPRKRNTVLADLIEDDPEGVDWHSREQTDRLLALMSEVNLAKVEAAKAAGRRMVGTIYKRTRPDGRGGRIQRAEVRFDDIAGCLRTPAGGSSRQTIMIVDGKKVRSRLLSPREAARLMGLPDDYRLPAKYNEAYHLAGDGVVVPVVRHIADNILERVLDHKLQGGKEAA